MMQHSCLKLLATWPEFDESGFLSIITALRGNRWSISSPPYWGKQSRIDLAETALSSFFGRNHAVTSCNGSAAIVMALQALGIGPGNRVLLPAMTWVGCASAILRCGAIPVFADSCAESPVMDVAAAAESCGQVDAILVVHTYASAQDICIVRKYFPGTPIVEDFSHCHGGRQADGCLLGRQGDISICSFQATKILTCGEGGAAFTDNYEIAERLCALRADSRIRHHDRLRGGLSDLVAHGSQHGYNLAMSEISAALLLDQLQRLPEQLDRRAKGAAAFQEAANALGLEIIGEQAIIASGGFYRLPVRAAGKNGRDLDLAAKALNIQLDKPYPPIPKSPLYQPRSVPSFRQVASERSEGNFPIAERWSESLCTIQHEFFLAHPSLLTELAYILLGKKRPIKMSEMVVCSGIEEVTIVILTQGDRTSLASAIASVALQIGVSGLNVLIVVDGNVCLELPSPSGAIAQIRQVSIHGSAMSGTAHSLIRVARLRNLAISLVETPLVTFLDDDNYWATDHLISLLDLLRRSGADVAHSWRHLEEPCGRAWSGQIFPWLPPGADRIARWQELLAEGIVVDGESIIRDQMFMSDGTAGMVDMGEWLFRTMVLRNLPFATDYNEKECRTMTGEDDKLLAQLVRNHVIGVCTERATLFYRLGGFSNADMHNQL